jgi:hypothetical protein
VPRPAHSAVLVTALQNFHDPCLSNVKIRPRFSGTLPARWIVTYDAARKRAYLTYNFGTTISVR